MVVKRSLLSVLIFHDMEIQYLVTKTLLSQQDFEAKSILLKGIFFLVTSGESFKALEATPTEFLAKNVFDSSFG
jgi:hypothetical protein